MESNKEYNKNKRVREDLMKLVKSKIYNDVRNLKWNYMFISTDIKVRHITEDIFLEVIDGQIGSIRSSLYWKINEIR